MSKSIQTFSNVIQTIPEGYVGFVYLIEQKSTGRVYVGQKHFYKKRKGIISESDWGSYRSSSLEVKKLINNNFTDFNFEIIALCKDEPILKLLEAKYMLYYDAISDKGFNRNIRLCLNGLIKDYEKRFTIIKEI